MDYREIVAKRNVGVEKRRFVHSFIHSSIHSFIHSFIHSLIHSFDIETGRLIDGSDAQSIPKNPATWPDWLGIRLET